MLHNDHNGGSVKIPRHLAIIMDGNGRWAVNRGQKRLMGHREGAKAVLRIVRKAAQLGVSHLTLFAFSSENWKRPIVEVNGLMELFSRALTKEVKELHKNGIKLIIIGDITKLSTSLQNSIQKAQDLTCNNTGMVLNLAVNYGGRWDILNACKSCIKDVQDGKISFDELSDDYFSTKLSEPLDVDLLIRSGGEMRISNFLLYQLAYAEIYITNKLWPDFNEDDLLKAIEFYSGRERRFGLTSEQIKEKEGC